MADSALDSIPVDVSSADQTLPQTAFALRASGAGNIVVQTMNGQERTLAFLAGETRHFTTGYIYKTGTTATGIEALVGFFAQAVNAVPTDNMTQPADTLTGNPSGGAADGADSPAGDGSDSKPS